jgi:hypothetical protein
MKTIMKAATGFFIAALCLGGCNGENASDKAAQNAAAPAAARKPAPKLAACPFRKTHDWKAFTEGGSLKVIGRVDLMMAGFRPSLSIRSSNGGTLALDLALASDPGAAVADQVRYQQAGTGVNRVDIYCGGDSVQSVEVLHVG